MVLLHLDHALSLIHCLLYMQYLWFIQIYFLLLFSLYYMFQVIQYINMWSIKGMDIYGSYFPIILSNILIWWCTCSCSSEVVPTTVCRLAPRRYLQRRYSLRQCLTEWMKALHWLIMVRSFSNPPPPTPPTQTSRGPNRTDNYYHYWVASGWYLKKFYSVVVEPLWSLHEFLGKIL